MKKLVFVIYIFFIIIFLNSNFYISNAEISVDGMVTDGQSFINNGKQQDKIQTIDGDKFAKVVKKVYKILFIIGVVVSIIIIGIIGITIMIGSMEEKAQMKEKMVPYVIGCAVMFGAFAIWKIIMIIAGDIS